MADVAPTGGGRTLETVLILVVVAAAGFFIWTRVKARKGAPAPLPLEPGRNAGAPQSFKIPTGGLRIPPAVAGSAMRPGGPLEPRRVEPGAARAAHGQAAVAAMDPRERAILTSSLGFDTISGGSSVMMGQHVPGGNKAVKRPDVVSTTLALTSANTAAGFQTPPLNKPAAVAPGPGVIPAPAPVYSKPVTVGYTQPPKPSATSGSGFAVGKPAPVAVPAAVAPKPSPPPAKSAPLIKAGSIKPGIGVLSKPLTSTSRPATGGFQFR